MARTTYLTTTLPYVNADPHIGFALEIVQADAYVRYRSLVGDSLFFNTGTDEHGIKILRKAQEQGKEPQIYVDEYAAKFRNLKEKLNLYPDIHFIRTTDAHHKAAAQEFWKRCEAAGDIYKKNYQVKYCVGCELEKTDSELADEKCPIHPNLSIELINEENYFFRWSKYQQALLDIYAARPDFVVPDFRFNEIKAFVERGLEDFSISRRKEKMPWGVPVPSDDEHVMYVWFDALINYVSTLGWPEKSEEFERFWGTVTNPNALQIAGKDNLRQQSAMWQAMLLSAGLPTTKQIVIHGFITSGGQKMSKSLGNVIDPYTIVDEYGTDALRYFLLRHIHPFEDSDFTMERFKDVYHADLANGIGNLASRIMTLAQTHLIEPVSVHTPTDGVRFVLKYSESLDEYNYSAALERVWGDVTALDQYMANEKPFSVVKVDPEMGKQMIRQCVEGLWVIARHLEPFMPATSEAIKNAVLTNTKPPNLFPRKESAAHSTDTYLAK